jgi:hypothetical protein
VITCCSFCPLLQVRGGNRIICPRVAAAIPLAWVQERRCDAHRRLSSLFRRSYICSQLEFGIQCMIKRSACSRGSQQRHTGFWLIEDLQGWATNITKIKGLQALLRERAGHRPYRIIRITGSSAPDIGSYIAKHDNKSACKLVIIVTLTSINARLRSPFSASMFHLPSSPSNRGNCYAWKA